MCIRKKTDIIEVVAVSISWLHILKIKDSSFIYTPEGMYFSELTINNTNNESNQTETSMSLESSDITIGKIIDMKDYVHSQYHDTQEIYLITIQSEAMLG